MLLGLSQMLLSNILSFILLLEGAQSRLDLPQHYTRVTYVLKILRRFQSVVLVMVFFFFLLTRDMGITLTWVDTTSSFPLSDFLLL